MDRFLSQAVADSYDRDAIGVGAVLHEEDRPSEEEPSFVPDGDDGDRMVGTSTELFRGRYTGVTQSREVSPYPVVTVDERTTCGQFCEMIGCPDGRVPNIDECSDAASDMGLLVKHDGDALLSTLSRYGITVQDMMQELGGQGFPICIVTRQTREALKDSRE